MTTIYLIRHSVRLKTDLIENYNTKQSNLIKSEKIILSVEGERRAEILSQKQELENIDKVYVSNCVRTISTAKYLCTRQNLKYNIDDRLDERRVGIPNSDIYPDWFTRQFKDENFKTENGESQKEVRERMYEVLSEILDENKNKRIAIFTHGYAIIYLLLKWCKLIDVSDDKIKIEYNNRVLLDRFLNAPEVFKLTFNNKELKNIELIEFSDIPFNEGI